MQAGNLAGARNALERERQRNPRSVDARVALGEVYYRVARDALDRERSEARYLTFLEHAVSEFVAAVELDPRDPRPHLYLATIDTYRGDIHTSLRGFRNARRLDPSPVAYTNLAEIYVYVGNLRAARRWNNLAVAKGSSPGPVFFNDMLIEWKEGDLRTARRQFSRLRTRYPEMLREINMARVPVEPRQFEDFAEYCCQSPACGPYMRDACDGLELEVQERQISEETVLEELRIEMERKRRLREVYRERKELEIEIEDSTP